MSIDKVHALVSGIPHMSLRQARTITEFIADHDLTDVLELGFRHGVSTCYIADRLDEIGRDWHMTTIDLESARTASPNVEELLQQIGLGDRVEVFYEPTSYTWRMMKMLEDDPNPRFDFCYLDGAHNWFVDGFAFFLVDRLLKPGGWIIFDDLLWTYEGSPSLRDSSMVREMPMEERTTRQVGKVFDLLVKAHPQYGEFLTNEDWGFARKMLDSPQGQMNIRREVVTEYVGLGSVTKEAYQKARAASRRILRKSGTLVGK